MGVVTDGLIAYWHYQQGFNGSTWENISPNANGSYNATMYNTSMRSDGVYFDGGSATYGRVYNPTILENFTFEICVKDEKLYNTTYVSSYVNDYNSARVGTGYLSGNNQVYADINTNDWGIYSYTPTNTVPMNAEFTVLVRVNYVSSTKSNMQIFINGNQVSSANGRYQKLYGDLFIGRRYYSNNVKDVLLGNIKFIRFYNRSLTDIEVLQNYQQGTSIGLDSLPQASEPRAIIISTTRNKISAQTNADRSDITFKFDTDVTGWKVKSGGTSHDSGLLADSGGATTKDTELTAIVDHTELYQEGQNKVNIYGLNDTGWTLYEN